MKAMMAVSGLIMIGYLLAHMYGNLKVFAGQEAFDDYAHHLRTLGEPILPYGGALWIIRVVLLVAIVAHVYSAVVLWKRDRRARGGTRATRAARPSAGSSAPTPPSPCAGAASSSCCSSSTTCCT